MATGAEAAWIARLRPFFGGFAPFLGGFTPLLGGFAPFLGGFALFGATVRV